jgi:hypothetical protein
MRDFDFTQAKEKKKPAYKKSKFYKCLNKKCRALIAEKLHEKYSVCPFCEGTDWAMSE